MIELYHTLHSTKTGNFKEKNQDSTIYVSGRITSVEEFDAAWNLFFGSSSTIQIG
jgi:hypothetical protein